jgi:hypothetical protein
VPRNQLLVTALLAAMLRASHHQTHRHGSGGGIEKDFTAYGGIAEPRLRVAAGSDAMVV